MAEPWFKVGDRVRGRKVSDTHDFSGDPDKRGVVKTIKVGDAPGYEIDGVAFADYAFTILLDGDKHWIPWYQWVFELDAPLSPFEAALRSYIDRELHGSA